MLLWDSPKIRRAVAIFRDFRVFCEAGHLQNDGFPGLLGATIRAPQQQEGLDGDLCGRPRPRRISREWAGISAYCSSPLSYAVGRATVELDTQPPPTAHARTGRLLQRGLRRKAILPYAVGLRRKAILPYASLQGVSQPFLKGD